MTLPHWVLPASEAFIRQTSVNRLHMERPAVSYLPLVRGHGPPAGGPGGGDRTGHEPRVCRDHRRFPAPQPGYDEKEG